VELITGVKSFVIQAKLWLNSLQLAVFPRITQEVMNDLTSYIFRRDSFELVLIKEVLLL